jgi:methylglutaconyl-CoA hydratase
MSTDRVVADLRDGVLWLTLNRPEKRNAIDAAMIDAIGEALARADLDAAVRVLAIRGAGKDFCAGMDLAELLASADRSIAENETDARRLGDLFVRMRALPKPVVAVVRGRALAGGCGLATACDLVLAHAEATFGYPEVRRGFVPAMVMAMLRRAVGEKVAFDLIATGRLLSADEARQVGLVSRVLPAELFEESVSTLLGLMAAGSASALALIKQQLYAIDGRDFEEAVALGARVNATARSTPDFRRAVVQFLEKKD